MIGYQFYPAPVQEQRLIEAPKEPELVQTEIILIL